MEYFRLQKEKVFIWKHKKNPLDINDNSSIIIKVFFGKVFVITRSHAIEV